MRLLALLLAIACCAGVAAADPTHDVDAAMVRVREHFARGELAEAKALLIATYAHVPRPDLLFALGQVELNLGNYAAAIDYYERFLATRPSSEQAALAQQAIGAARARQEQPAARPLPPPPPLPAPKLVRDWDRIDTVLAVTGGAIVVAGMGVAGYGYHVGRDRSGTLADYDARVDRSRTLQRTGFAISAGGALVVGAALVRWGVHRVEVAPITGPETVGLAFGRRW
jgi:tetratricopeptide (TPR) repeat protein